MLAAYILAWCVCIISYACLWEKENPEKTATDKALKAAAKAAARKLDQAKKAKERAEKKAQDALDRQRKAKLLADSKIAKVGFLEHIKLVDLF